MKQLVGYLILVGIISICWTGSYAFFSQRDTMGGFVCFGIGSIFAALFFYAIGSEIRTRQTRAFVEKGYEVINTEFSYVEEFGEDYYHIHTRWVDPDGGAVYRFKSDYIDFNPEMFLRGKTISVKISLTDYKRYTVDLSMLPKKA